MLQAIVRTRISAATSSYSSDAQLGDEVFSVLVLHVWECYHHAVTLSWYSQVANGKLRGCAASNTKSEHLDCSQLLLRHAPEHFKWRMYCKTCWSKPATKATKTNSKDNNKGAAVLEEYVEIVVDEQIVSQLPLLAAMTSSAKPDVASEGARSDKAVVGATKPVAGTNLLDSVAYVVRTGNDPEDDLERVEGDELLTLLRTCWPEHCE